MGKKILSYQALKEQIVCCAQSLKERGIDPGDHVAIMLPNVPQ